MAYNETIFSKRRNKISVDETKSGLGEGGEGTKKSILFPDDSARRYCYRLLSYLPPPVSARLWHRYGSKPGSRLRAKGSAASFSVVGMGAQFCSVWTQAPD